MIPLSIPHFNGNEWDYVKECIDTGWVSMAGSYVTKFEQMVADYAGSKYGVASVNGTCGLHMAMHLLGVSRGDKVIVPNITFVASANSVSYTGAEAIYVDIDPDTWQLDLNLLESWLENNTVIRDNKCYLLDENQSRISAIMPVHVLGNMCDMERLMSISKKYFIPVVEDASESLGSYFNGKHSGSFGDISVFSFNGNKIITTGGGGVIVSNDEALAKRAKHLTTQAKVDPETYFHDEIGYNYRMVNVLAALGVAQMEQLDGFIEKKKFIDNYYRSNLEGVGDIKFQKVEKNVNSNCWLFTFYTERQEDILREMKKNKIIARPFWFPMNQLPMFKDNLYVTKNDHARDIHLNCLSIPSSVNLKEEQMKQVVDVIKSVY